MDDIKQHEIEIGLKLGDWILLWITIYIILKVLNYV
jgi:hypothetical protein